MCRSDHIAPFQKSHLDHDQQRPTTSSRDILTMDFWRKIMMPTPVTRKRDPSPPMTPEARLERYKRGWAAVKVLQASSLPLLRASSPRVTLSFPILLYRYLTLEILDGSLQSPCNPTHISLPTSTHLPHSHSIASSP